jgi:hypothetical protein
MYCVGLKHQCNFSVTHTILVGTLRLINTFQNEQENGYGLSALCTTCHAIPMLKDNILLSVLLDSHNITGN